MPSLRSRRRRLAPCLLLATVAVAAAAAAQLPRAAAQPRPSPAAPAIARPAGAWRAVHCAAPPRVHHAATLLADGRVLFTGGVGGRASSTVFDDAYVYDAVSDVFAAVAPMPEPRYHHTATRLPDGRVVVAGGAASGTLASTAVFDPARGAWSAAAPLHEARRGHTAAVIQGALHVMGGLDGAGSAGLRSVERFDPVAGAWSAAAPLLRPRYLHTATLLPTGAAVLLDSTGVEVYPASGPVVPAPAGMLPLSEAVALDASTVLFTGGMTEGHDGAADARTWRVGGAFARVRPMGHARFGHTATRLADGRVLVVGGATAELFDRATRAWTPAAPPPPGVGRGLHSATLLADGTVLVAFGAEAGGCARFDPHGAARP